MTSDRYLEQLNKISDQSGNNLIVWHVPDNVVEIDLKREEFVVGRNEKYLYESLLTHEQSTYVLGNERLKRDKLKGQLSFGYIPSEFTISGFIEAGDLLNMILEDGTTKNFSDLVKQFIHRTRFYAPDLVCANGFAFFEEIEDSQVRFIGYKNSTSEAKCAYFVRDGYDYYCSAYWLYMVDDNIVVRYRINNSGSNSWLELEEFGLTLTRKLDEFSFTAIKQIRHHDCTPPLERRYFEINSRCVTIGAKRNSSLKIVSSQKVIPWRWPITGLIDKHHPDSEDDIPLDYCDWIASDIWSDHLHGNVQFIHFAVVPNSFILGDKILILKNDVGPYNSFAVYNMSQGRLFIGYKSSICNVTNESIERGTIFQVRDILEYRCRLTPYSDQLVDGIKLVLSDPLDFVDFSMEDVHKRVETIREEVLRDEMRRARDEDLDYY